MELSLLQHQKMTSGFPLLTCHVKVAQIQISSGVNTTGKIQHFFKHTNTQHKSDKLLSAKLISTVFWIIHNCRK